MNEEYVIFIGGPCVDEYYAVRNWPKEGDKFLGKFEGNVPGGMIANAACVYAGYGKKTYIFSGMGDNPTTDFLLKDMEENHVDTSEMILDKDFHDGKCIIFQGDSDRTILVVEGDKQQFELSEEKLRFLCGAKYVYTTLQCMKQFKDSEKIFDILKEHGVRIVLDNEASTYVEDWRRYMKNAYIGFFNEYSLQLFKKEKSEEEFISELFDMGLQVVVETLGADGCKVITKEKSFSASVFDISIVDTTGAGDTFNSSFMYAQSCDWPLEKSAVFATAAADMAIMKQGPRGGITTEEKVFDFIAKSNKKIINTN